MITITGGSTAQQSAIHDVLTGNEYAGYDVTSAPNGGYVLTMKQAAIRDLEDADAADVDRDDSRARRLAGRVGADD